MDILMLPVYCFITWFPFNVYTNSYLIKQRIRMMKTDAVVSEYCRLFSQLQFRVIMFTSVVIGFNDRRLSYHEMLNLIHDLILFSKKILLAIWHILLFTVKSNNGTMQVLKIPVILLYHVFKNFYVNFDTIYCEMLE